MNVNDIVFYIISLIIPIIVGCIIGYLVHKDTNDKVFTIMMVIVGIVCSCMVSALIISVCGYGAIPNDDFYNTVPQKFVVNEVEFKYTDNRYINVKPPEGFYGRISILNTETRYGLFSVAIDKGEVFSKAITPKEYVVDTSYTGSNQITVEVENADRYESHVFTLQKFLVRAEDDIVPFNTKIAVQVVG